MNQMLSGAIAVASLIAALFFALSFLLEGCNRVALALLERATEDEPLFYSVRVLAYGLIVAAIWQKNRRRP
jgi:hypothetical protein